MRIFPAEPVGPVDQHGLHLALGNQVSQPLQARPAQGGSAVAFVLKDPTLRYCEAVGLCILTQAAGLTGDRFVLLLPVRGHTGINRG